MAFEQVTTDQSKSAPHPVAAVSVAPMMEWTDRHCRVLLRRFSRSALLYTEMVTTRALLAGDAERFLGFDVSEQPLALQLGGSDPSELAACARMGEVAGYQEINLNVGCPSPRVQKGAFGACLMREPALVADCVRAMTEAVSIPVTVKTRIGVDDDDSEAFLFAFVSAVNAAGNAALIVHARKAFLKGLSPAQNRNVPPLNYDRAARVKECFSEIPVIVNGGVTQRDQYDALLARFDGVMIGRAAYHNPALLADIEQGRDETMSLAARLELLTQHLDYVDDKLREGERLHAMTRHMLSIFNGFAGARAYRRDLSELPRKTGAGTADVLAALEHLRQRAA